MSIHTDLLVYAAPFPIAVHDWFLTTISPPSIFILFSNPFCVGKTKVLSINKKRIRKRVNLTEEIVFLGARKGQLSEKGRYDVGTNK